MAVLGVALNSIGLILLTHAVYSAHEHAVAFAHTPLPFDISIELLVSILILSAGIVTSSPELKPIQWARWAGKLQREGRHTEGKRTREGEEILSEGDPYEFLGLSNGFGPSGEGRRGFWDVRAKRQEYAQWVRSRGKK